MRWSREEAEVLLAAWRASGVSLARFCRERGVAAHRMVYWQKRVQVLAGQTAAAELGGFVQLPPQAVLPPGEHILWALRGPGNMCLEGRAWPDAHWLRALLAGVPC